MMSDHIESVSAIAAFFEEQANDADGHWRERFVAYSEALAAVRHELIRLYDITSALPSDLGNVHDLPPELLGELSGVKADELEDQLVTVINAYGGEANLDQILVGLYRKFSLIQKRRFIQNKLYRMDVVWSVDGKKGFYTTAKSKSADEVSCGDEASVPLVTLSYPKRGKAKSRLLPEDDNSDLI